MLKSDLDSFLSVFFFLFLQVTSRSQHQLLKRLFVLHCIWTWLFCRNCVCMSRFNFWLNSIPLVWMFCSTHILFWLLFCSIRKSGIKMPLLSSYPPPPQSLWWFEIFCSLFYRSELFVLFRWKIPLEFDGHWTEFVNSFRKIFLN